MALILEGLLILYIKGIHALILKRFPRPKLHLKNHLDLAQMYHKVHLQEILVFFLKQQCNISNKNADSI